MTKRKTAHDPATGRFESLSPMNDPALLDQCVRWVRAINELEPLARSFAKDSDDPSSRAAALIAAEFMKSLKPSLLQALEVDTTELKRAKNPVLRAPRRRQLPEKGGDPV